jgi:hypothetical protein
VLSYVSHFSALGLAVSLATACTNSNDASPTNSNEKIILVSSEFYRKKPCWTHEYGSFRAFLVFGREDNYAVPEFISVNCEVTGDHASYGESTILHMGVVLIVDTNGKLQTRFPNLQIAGNVASDQPFPSEDSELYYFKADLEKVAHPYQSVYAPSNIRALVDLHMSFGDFLSLPREKREKLLQSIK